MAKLTPRLPLLLDKSQPGFELIDETEIKDLIRQNIKMILLTNPGERVMLPEFGVGIMGLLFENFSDQEIITKYQGEISSQINNYLPYIDLQEIDFLDSEMDVNKISIKVRYYIPALGESDVLEILKSRGSINGL